MRKFLSLVLALVMTLSLVTISAGATEYKDLTDKDEIQYEEAVAVLNKLGIISGYTDGSFNPTGALTRGAAAKIIVSLMIGSEAASNLSITTAPYTDVPVDNTFAAVISYCKTAGYVDGYGDGTFHPADPLTGYAFTKMLLGALGYRGDIEGFSGTGWTMNVAKLGNKAGLFNDFIDAFKGNDGVTREQACLLALNTIKATEVEYVGNQVTVAGDNVNVTVGNTAYSYVTSRNDKINANIDASRSGNSSDYLTLEFGEEHFTDLKLDTTTYDDFGRPSNTWSLKNVEIGTYAKAADKTYTAGASGDTNADKVKSMGIKGYTVYADGYFANGDWNAFASPYSSDRLEEIAALTANGTVVTLYLDDETANQIDTVVVIESQAMEIDQINTSAKSVTLKQLESTGVPVTTVRNSLDEDLYTQLSALKAGDIVVVTPLYNSGSYDVDSAYVPETASGRVNKVTLKADGVTANGVTVGETAYKMSSLWTAKDGRGNLSASSVTSKKDCTVYLDKYGYVIYAKDVQASSDWFIFAARYSNVVNGKIHYFASGYDMDGNDVSLDLGTDSSAYSVSGVAATIGQVVKYTVATTSNNDADYQLTDFAPQAKTTGAAGYFAAGIAYNATKLDTDQDGSLADETMYFNSKVKFIFETCSNGEVTGVTVKDGVQQVTAAADNTGVKVYYTTTTVDGVVEIDRVIVTNDSDVDVSTDVLYVSKIAGSITDSAGKQVSTFNAYIDGAEVKDLTANKIISADTFYTYVVEDGIYKLSAYTGSGKSTSVVTDATMGVQDILNASTAIIDGTRLGLDIDLRTNSDTRVVGVKTAVQDLNSLKAMKDSGYKQFTVSAIYNGSNTNNQGIIKYLYVTAASTTPVADYISFTVAGTEDVRYYTSAADAAAGDNALTADTYKYLAGKTLYAVPTTDAWGIKTSDSSKISIDPTIQRKPDSTDQTTIYKVYVNASANGNVISHDSDTDWVTYTSDADWTLHLQADCSDTAVTSGTYLQKGTTIYLQAAAALQDVTSVTGVNIDTTIVHTPTTGTDKAIYSGTITGAISDGSSAVAWYSIGFADADPTLVEGGITMTLSDLSRTIVPVSDPTVSIKLTATSSVVETTSGGVYTVGLTGSNGSVGNPQLASGTANNLTADAFTYAGATRITVVTTKTVPNGAKTELVMTITLHGSDTITFAKNP